MKGPASRRAFWRFTPFEKQVRMQLSHNLLSTPGNISWTEDPAAEKVKVKTVTLLSL